MTFWDMPGRRHQRARPGWPNVSTAGAVTSSGNVPGRSRLSLVADPVPPDQISCPAPSTGDLGGSVLRRREVRADRVHDPGFVLDVDQLAATQEPSSALAGLVVVRVVDVPPADAIRVGVAGILGLGHACHRSRADRDGAGRHTPVRPSISPADRISCYASAVRPELRRRRSIARRSSRSRPAPRVRSSRDRWDGYQRKPPPGVEICASFSAAQIAASVEPVLRARSTCSKTASGQHRGRPAALTENPA